MGGRGRGWGACGGARGRETAVRAMAQGTGRGLILRREVPAVKFPLPVSGRCRAAGFRGFEVGQLLSCEDVAGDCYGVGA